MRVNGLPLETRNNTLNLCLYLAIVWKPISLQYCLLACSYRCCLLLWRCAARLRFWEAWTFLWVLLGYFLFVIGAELIFCWAVFSSRCVLLEIQLCYVSKTNFSPFNTIFTRAVFMQFRHIWAFSVTIMVISMIEERFLLAWMVIAGLITHGTIS